MNACPKCKEPMEEGYVFDKSDSGKAVAAWVAGPPEQSIWTGLKTRVRENIPMRTFRCTGCGFLEFYATKTV